jgi:hypothetical protein
MLTIIIDICRKSLSAYTHRGGGHFVDIFIVFKDRTPSFFVGPPRAVLLIFVWIRHFLFSLFDEVCLQIVSVSILAFSVTTKNRI